MPGAIHNVGGWLARRADWRGDQIAIVDADRSLDYAALADRTARCAAVLAASGLDRGDRVAIVLGNRSAYLEAIFAAASLGAIAVPINARLTAYEIARLFADCEPTLVIHEVELTDVVTDAARRCGHPHIIRIASGGAPDEYEARLAAAEPDARVEEVSPDDPMLLMYTSGTTGSPKGALLPHRKTLYNSLNAELFFDLTSRDRVLVALPLFHSFGLCILSIPTLYTGGTVYLAPRFIPADVWRTVEREQITFFGGVPTMFRALLDALGSEPRDLPSLRFLFTAGAAIPVDLIRSFEARGLVLKQGFGQTETSILCCLDARDAIRKAGSVGRPVFHAALRVVRQDSLSPEPAAWVDAAIDEPGEIVVRGPITMLGYWRMPDATAEVLRGEWLRTGDLATTDADGFLTLVGRARDLYISGGENVYPAEVEAVLAEHPDVAEIAIVGVPDSRWGETGHAHVVPTAGRSVDGEAILRWARERLAVFKLPTSFIEVTSLPRTPTGKVRRGHLDRSQST